MFIHRLFASIALLSLTLSGAFSQNLYSTIAAPGKPAGIQGMMMGDDIFLSMQLQGGQGQLSVLVQPNGEYRKIDLSSVGKNPIVAGVTRNDSTCFYYLKYLNKKVVLSTLLMNKDNDRGQELPETIDIPGVIYGSYVEGSDLFMLCGVKDEFKLKLLQIRNGKHLSTSEFGLTFNLGKRKGQRVTFYDMSNPVSPQQVIGDVKICKDGRAIWILIDEPMDDTDLTMADMTMFRTTAIKLDLDSKKTVVKSFYELTKSRFTSSVFNGDIIRMVLDRGLRIEQHDFNTGKKKESVLLTLGKEIRRDSTYVRIGSSFKTLKDIRGAAVLNRVFGSYIIVDSLANGERIFTIGDYGDKYPYMFLFGGPLPIVNLIITASSLVVGELVEGSISTVYFYYRGSLDKGMRPTYDVPLLRKRVDDFDYSQTKKRIKFAYRGYINLPQTTYEISQEEGSNRIEIRKFQADAPSASSPAGG